MGIKGAGRPVTARAPFVVSLLVFTALAVGARAQGEFDARGELTLAHGEYITRDFERARDRLERILGANTTDSLRLEALALHARCWTQLRNPTRAVEAFKEALRVDAAWQPDADELEAAEFTLFEQARREFQAEQALLALPPCPGSTTPIVATVVFVASSIFFLSAKSGADDRWSEYEADPSHPADLYDDYTGAKHRQDIGLVATAVSGLASGYLWYRYVHDGRACREAEPKGPSLGLLIGVPKVAVVGRF
ncbi:MAG: hypothetical protein IPK64_00265 [bacterium]|nr:hypothetical protein [bacterium]